MGTGRVAAHLKINNVGQPTFVDVSRLEIGLALFD
jgi:hypothetical protein